MDVKGNKAEKDTQVQKAGSKHDDQKWEEKRKLHESAPVENRAPV